MSRSHCVATPGPHLAFADEGWSTHEGMHEITDKLELKIAPDKLMVVRCETLNAFKKYMDCAAACFLWA